MRLTHQNIANTIRATRVTITRFMVGFQREGFISYDDDHHIILRENFAQRLSQMYNSPEVVRSSLYLKAS